MTDRFKLLSGGTLGPPLDANCSIATRVDYVYRATGTAPISSRWPIRRPSRRTPRWSPSNGQTGAVHRPDRDRHDQPRDLPDRDAAQPGERSGARFRVARRGLEWQADLHVRRRLRARLVPAGRLDRRRHGRRAAAAGIRGRVRVARRGGEQLQRRDFRRNDDDGQGAVHRGVRRAALHDWLGLVGRRHPAVPDRATTIRDCSTA